MPRNWLKTLTTNIQYAVYNMRYTIYGIQYTGYNRMDGWTAGRPDGRSRVQILLVQIL